MVALTAHFLHAWIYPIHTHYNILHTRGTGIWKCHSQYIHGAHWSETWCCLWLPIYTMHSLEDVHAYGYMTELICYILLITPQNNYIKFAYTLIYGASVSSLHITLLYLVLTTLSPQSLLLLSDWYTGLHVFFYLPSSLDVWEVVLYVFVFGILSFMCFLCQAWHWLFVYVLPALCIITSIFFTVFDYVVMSVWFGALC